MVNNTIRTASSKLSNAGSFKILMNSSTVRPRCLTRKKPSSSGVTFGTMDHRHQIWFECTTDTWTFHIWRWSLKTNEEGRDLDSTRQGWTPQLLDQTADQHTRQTSSTDEPPHAHKNYQVLVDNRTNCSSDEQLGTRELFLVAAVTLKLLTTISAEEVKKHLVTHDLMPEEQKGNCRQSRGTKD